MIRNQLISLSESDLLFFQDSDDISCADRFEHIGHYMKENECQLCGSHEVKLNYFNRTVQAVRYPLDVMKALKKGSARIHANSLTIGPETHIGSPARNNLLSRLVTDFELVKIGILKLENSSLKYEAPGFNFEVKKI